MSVKTALRQYLSESYFNVVAPSGAGRGVRNAGRSGSAVIRNAGTRGSSVVSRSSGPLRETALKAGAITRRGTINRNWLRKVHRLGRNGNWGANVGGGVRMTKELWRQVNATNIIFRANPHTTPFA